MDMRILDDIRIRCSAWTIFHTMPLIIFQFGRREMIEMMLAMDRTGDGVYKDGYDTLTDIALLKCAYGGGAVNDGVYANERSVFRPV